MLVSQILDDIKFTRGTNNKKDILDTHRDNKLLRQALKYGLDPFSPSGNSSLHFTFGTLTILNGMRLME